MVERSIITLGSPQPITPKKRGGELPGLLAQFGSQNSAESATKLRRVSLRQEANRSSTIAPSHDNKAALEPLSSDNHPQIATPEQTPSTPDSSADELAMPLRTSRGRTLKEKVEETRRRSRKEIQEATRAGPEQSNDMEPHVKPDAEPVLRASARLNKIEEVLQMEKRRKDREAQVGRRQSTRDKKTRILESDTMPTPPPSTRYNSRGRPRKPARPPKLDTTRARLRDVIARKTKAKADNFMMAKKDYFLPLLPPNNRIVKLFENHNAKPIVEYEELQEQPEGVTATMKPYQLSGLSFLVHLYNNGVSGILGDEMGLGKTLQTLSLFQYLEELDRKNGVTSEEPRPYLVICPLSVLNSWVTEAEKWVPELGVLRFHGAASERERLKRVASGMEDLKGNETLQSKNRKASRKAGLKVSYKIIVTTYETFASDQSWFKSSFIRRYVVLDEGHKIKSNTTQISTSLRHLNSEYRLILTGTPLQNNLTELWALLAWLYPDVFSDKTQTLFKESFDLNKGQVNRQTMDDARRLLELVMLRRMKDSPGVDLGLPPKEEVLLYVPLTPMQRFWYTRLLTRVDDNMLAELFTDGKSKEKAAILQDKQEDQMLEHMEKLQAAGDEGEWEETAAIMRQAMEKEKNDTGAKSDWHKLMNLVMQLRKCCSHPYLLPQVAPDPYYLGDHIIRASGKFILLEKLLKHTVMEQGKKVLIFSGFTATLDYTEDFLSLISDHGQSFKHLRLDGSTARAKRNLDIRLFNQEASAYKVMLLSTRAGGLGINLTSAQDVIFLDEDWNPQITLQAEARAHRIGQTKPVTIYKLCTQGTVEEQMMGRIRKKLYLSAKITESMRNIHTTHSTPKANARGRPSLADDMPQMDTTQLKTLVRRGAQALSHPDIDATEMASWDLTTMLARCRDKPTDASATHSDEDEARWLAAMERVECAVFDGKRYARQQAASAAADILPDTIARADRRKGKNTTVMLDGYAVNKESLQCGDWEAVPTLAGKDPRLVDVKTERRVISAHEAHCLSCFESSNGLLECRSCPRAFHAECLDPSFPLKWSGFFCPQHTCSQCAKSTADAGGLIYRCRWCPSAWCEDCLDWNTADLLGDGLPEFEVLGEEGLSGGWYVVCGGCQGEKGARRRRREGYEKSVEAQRKKEMNVRKRKADEMDEEVEAPTPALTDTSALTASRLGTPGLGEVVEWTARKGARKSLKSGNRSKTHEVVVVE
jgi:SWI/SNF-related matrix-associated actin-dependent regulator of chromatin subfamily A member 5